MPGPVQPSRADVHVNRPLNNMSLAMIQDAGAFIADGMFPTIPVTKQSDRYFTYERGEFNRDEMRLRAPSTESAGGSYTIDSTPNYFCDTYAFHRDIDEQIRANADDPLDPDREATLYITMKGLLKREVLFASKYFTTGKWTTDITGVDSAPGSNQVLRWNVANSNPIQDIRTGKRVVLESTNKLPNKLALQRYVFDALMDHPDIIGRIDHGQTGGPAIANRRILADLFELEEVLVMDAIQNTAKEGQTAAHSFIGGKGALLAYVAPAPGIMTASAGYTFAWTGLMGSNAFGGRILKFPMVHLRSDRVEMDMSFDQKLVAADLGYFFSSIVA